MASEDELDLDLERALALSMQEVRPLLWILTIKHMFHIRSLIPS
jgi:hypothetical protein